MNIKSIRSDKVYLKMIASPIEKRNDIYRYELMQPFEGKWACYHIPLKAPTENGYDVVMASSMLGFMAPIKVDDNQKESVARLSSDNFWKQCQGSIERSLKCFTDYGVDLPTKDYLFTVLLANPESPYTILNEAYIGNMVQGKCGTVSYKNKKLVAKPADEWIRVENTHEPLISKEMWDIVCGMD